MLKRLSLNKQEIKNYTNIVKKKINFFFVFDEESFNLDNSLNTKYIKNTIRELLMCLF